MNVCEASQFMHAGSILARVVCFPIYSLELGGVQVVVVEAASDEEKQVCERG